MNRPLVKFCQDRFDDFRSDLLLSWGIASKVAHAYDRQLRTVHKRYLSLACMCTVVGKGAPRKDYVAGVVEAAYLSIVLAAKGIENTSCVLLRQTLELVLKHVYFSTHPVEFGWAMTRESYRELTFQYLLEYLAKTDECKALGWEGMCGTKLGELLAVLSRYVHVHSRDFMRYRALRRGTQTVVAALKRLDNLSRQLWPRLVVTLIAHFPAKFVKASSAEKQLILSGLPRKLRDAAKAYLREMATG